MKKIKPAPTPFARIDAKSADGVTKVYIDGVISDFEIYSDENIVTAKQLVSALTDITDNKVELHINSPGGDCFAGLKIYNALRALSAEKETVCYIDGLAGSIASIFPFACGKVVMPEASFLMIHKPWLWMQGNADELRASADELDKIEDKLLRIYAAKSNIDDEAEAKEYFATLLRGEAGADGTWLNADQAFELGLCDEIDADIRAVACTDALDMFDSVPERVKKICVSADKRKLEELLHKSGYSRNESKRIAAGKAAGATPDGKENSCSVNWDLVTEKLTQKGL